MREEVHLHVEGEQLEALKAVARSRGMSRTQLAVKLVFEAWRRDIEGQTPEINGGVRASLTGGTVAEQAVQLVMESAVKLQEPWAVDRLAVIDESYAAGVPVTVASSLEPPQPALGTGAAIETTARED